MTDEVDAARLRAQLQDVKQALRELVAKHDHPGDSVTGANASWSYITPVEVLEILNRIKL